VTTGRSVPVYTLDPLADPRWAELVARHPAATVFHTPAWLEALQGAYGYRATVFSTCSPRDELTNGLLVCRVRSWLTGRRMVSVPFADHCDLLLDASGDGAELVHAAHAAAKAENSSLQLRTATSLPAIEGGLAASGSYRLHRLDLTASVDELFARTHRSTIQRRIRHAAREDLRCDVGRSDELLEAFYRLVILTRRRHGVPPQPLSWFRTLVASFGEDARIRVALHAGRAVGAIMTLRHRDALVYKYGASDSSYHRLGVMPLLFWKAIEEAKALGLRTLDLGRSDLDNPGLIRFKDRLGAVSAPLTYVGSSARKPARLRWVMRFSTSLVRRLPDALFTAAGRVLYPHLG